MNSWSRITLALLTALATSGIRWHASGAPLQPVPVPMQISVSAGGDSFTPVVCTNSWIIAFVSEANNLTMNDDLGAFLDVFVRDLNVEDSVLVSVATNGFGGGNDHSVAPAVSADGRFVAFESAANNLTLNDTNALSDVFVRDLIAGTTSLVSISTNGRSANGASGTPLISTDGRWIIFESAASNLVTADLNGSQDIFARDRVTQTTILVSTNAVGAGTNRGACHSAAITPDGRFVAFVKAATNGIFSTYADIYVRDLQLGVTLWASTNVLGAGPLAPYQCSSPSLSADGRFVVFIAVNATSVPRRIFRHDLQTGITVTIHDGPTDLCEPKLSADGRFAVFEARTGVYVWDSQSSSNHLVHTNFLANLHQAPMSPVISADGTRIAFVVTSNGIASVQVSDWQGGNNWVASVTTNGLPATASDAATPLLSPDGRYLFFESHDSRIVASDWNRSSDVFRTELANSSTRLVSERHPDRPSRTGSAGSGVLPLAISANGNSVGFWGLDGNLSGDDTNGYQDGFVRRIRDDAQHFLGQNVMTSGDVVFNSDGRFVAFRSGSGPVTWFPALGTVTWRDLATGSNFLVTSSASRNSYMSLGIPPIAISGDGMLVACHDATDVFLHDIRAGTSQVVSLNVEGTATGNGVSTTLMFSPNDHWLFFASTATNLTTNTSPGLFARDLRSNTTIQINANFAATGYRRVIAVSANSRFVASQGTDWSLELFDFTTGGRMKICDNCWSPSLSSDGRWMAFEQRNPAPFQSGRQIILRDLVNGTTNLITTNVFGPFAGNRDSTRPSITHDGRFVVFASYATNLVAGDNNDTEDIFIRDVRRNVTLLASLNRAGTGPGNGPSLMPIVAGDGRTVVFQSFASDLTDGDFNEAGDVFMLTLSGPDNDKDGLDDNWELAYFDNLDRDGAGDYDGDGASDSSEFLAGTDPANTASILTVLTINNTSGGAPSVLWSAIPGRSYRVQFKNRVNEATWTDASEVVTANGSTGSWADGDSEFSDQRFYRVLLIR